MTYNKSEIMKRSWTIYKNRNSLILSQIRNTPKTASWYGSMVSKVIPFAQILREVWAEARASVARATAATNNPELAAEIDRLSYVIKFCAPGHGKGSYATCEEISRSRELIAKKQRLEAQLMSA